MQNIATQGIARIITPRSFYTGSRFLNLEQLVTKIKSNNAKVILMTIPPFIEKYLLKRHKLAAFKIISPQARIESINNIVKETGEKYDTPVIDVYKVFEKNGGANESHSSLLRNLKNSNSMDGVHPTARGYKLIAKAVAKNIKGNNLSVKRIICFGDSITYGAGVEQSKNSFPAILQQLL